MTEGPFRYTVFVRLRPDVEAAQCDAMLAEMESAMASANFPCRFERGVALQPGVAHYAMVIDFSSPDELAAWNAPSAEHAILQRIAGDKVDQVLVLCQPL